MAFDGYHLVCRGGVARKHPKPAGQAPCGIGPGPDSTGNAMARNDGEQRGSGGYVDRTRTRSSAGPGDVVPIPGRGPEA
jgi:hypothetical protein